MNNFRGVTFNQQRDKVTSSRMAFAAAESSEKVTNAKAVFFPAVLIINECYESRRKEGKVLTLRYEPYMFNFAVSLEDGSQTIFVPRHRPIRFEAPHKDCPWVYLPLPFMVVDKDFGVVRDHNSSVFNMAVLGRSHIKKGWVVGGMWHCRSWCFR